MLLNNDFLLKGDWSKKLFHNYAEKMPIIDYHCHLIPKEIYENKQYDNLTQVWLYDNGFGDHYKWRLLRANGTEETYITGDGEAYEKYLEFVKAVGKAVGNPIYEWSHLELRRYFGIDLTINLKNARAIWDQANALLKTQDFRAKSLIRRMQVKVVCTTDDPVSDLRYHKLLRAEEQENGFRVLPTFRPDGLLDIGTPDFVPYIQKLEDLCGTEIHSFPDLERAVEERVRYFHEVGGRLADHSLNTFTYVPATEQEISELLARRLSGRHLSQEENCAYQTAIQLTLMRLYVKYNWTLQLHMNCFRDGSDINLKAIGLNSGFDSVGDQSNLGRQLLNLFNEAEKRQTIPKMILYSLNENDMPVLATLMGSFQGMTKQRIHLGCAWWFNDTYNGMKNQLTMYASQSLLGNFVGMLTDSRSFLSYPRHEYFRRILCTLLGEWIEDGRLPEDEEYLGQIVEDICYHNAYEYFHFFDKETD